MLNNVLINNGFKQSLADPCMHVKHDGKDIVILLIWVDDIVVASGSASMLDKVRAMLSQKFKMKDLGVISRFLGIDFMNQEHHLSKLLEGFGMTKCKPKSSPSEQELIFSENAEPFDLTKHRKIIG